MPGDDHVYLHDVNFETLQLAVEFEALHFTVESQSVFLCTSLVVASAVVVVDVISGGFPNDFSPTAFASVAGSYGSLFSYRIFLIWATASMKLCKDCCCLRRRATFSAVFVLTARH